MRDEGGRTVTSVGKGLPTYYRDSLRLSVVKSEG